MIKRTLNWLANEVFDLNISFYQNDLQANNLKRELKVVRKQSKQLNQRKSLERVIK